LYRKEERQFIPLISRKRKTTAHTIIEGEASKQK
jgi:hypothetical protein